MLAFSKGANSFAINSQTFAKKHQAHSKKQRHLQKAKKDCIIYQYVGQWAD